MGPNLNVNYLVGTCMLGSWWTEKLGYFSIRYVAAHKSCFVRVLGVVLETLFPHQNSKGNFEDAGF